MRIYCSLINYTTPGNIPINSIIFLGCVVSNISGGKWFLDYLYQQCYSVLLNIIVVPFSTLPVNIYIRNSLLSRFPIAPNQHHIFLKSIETHKTFASDIFKVISVHSMKKLMNSFFLITGYLLFNIQYRYSLALSLK